MSGFLWTETSRNAYRKAKFGQVSSSARPFEQGRLSDARTLHEEAIHGFEKLHGVDHEDTLKAIHDLGRAVMMFHTEENYHEARFLQHTVLVGMCKFSWGTTTSKRFWRVKISALGSCTLGLMSNFLRLTI